MNKNKIGKIGLIGMVCILIFSQTNLSVLAMFNTTESETEKPLTVEEQTETFIDDEKVENQESVTGEEAEAELPSDAETEVVEEASDLVKDLKTVGFSLESSLDKNTLDLDATSVNDQQVKVTFNITHLDTTSKLNNGVLVIDFSDTNLVLVENSYPTSSTSIKSATYSKSEKKLTVTFKDNINGSFDFPFLVEASIVAKTGDQYQIKATMNGTNAAGEAYTEVKNETEKIAITGTSKDYIEADSESIKKWKLNSSFANPSGYPGQYLDQYAAIASGSMLHFTNLKVEKDYNGLKSWQTPREMSVIATGNKGEVIQDDDEKKIALFGEQNLEKISLFDSSNIPLDVAAGTYSVTYHIYNDDIYLFSITKKTVVKEAGTVLTYLSNALGNQKIGTQDKFNWKYRLHASGGPELPKNITMTFKIPEGVQLLTYGIESTMTVGKLEYEQNNTGNWQVVPNNTVDFSTIENLTRLRVTAKDGTLAPPSFGNIRLQNVSVPAGSDIHLITESIQYTDTFGETHDLVQETENAAFDVTVQVTDTSLNEGASRISTAVTPLSDRAKFPENPIYNGFSYSEALKIGARQGEPFSQPYAFMILPKGFVVSQIPFNYIGTNMLTGLNILDVRLPYYSNPSSPGQGKMERKTLSDGRTIQYVVAPDTELQGTAAHLEYLLGGFTIRAENAKAGDYQIEYGMGSLTQDDYEVVEANGLTEETLPAEIKEVLGAKANSYLTMSKPITVGALNGVSTEAAIKGSENPDFLDGTAKTASSMPGRTVDYRYTITNNGTQGIHNFEMIDILPHLNDTFITNNNARGSEYAVNATDSIQVAVNGKNAGATLEYATTYTPARFDGAGADVPGDKWSTTKPADITKVKAIRVVLTQPLEPGDKVTLSYTGILPVDAPRNGEIASNTIAYRGNIQNNEGQSISTTALELSKTNVAAVAPVNDGALSGNIFMDLNKNGNKDTNEPGYNGVKVELFKASDLTKPMATTTTTPAGTIQGAYSFIDLPYDNYKIRLTLPKNATFIQDGLSGLEIDAQDETYAWVKKNDKTTFTLSDISGVGTKTIADLDAAIYATTPLNGKVVFVDKEGHVVEGATYGANYEVSLENAAGKEIATTKADAEGNYEFLDLVIPAKADYQVVFKAPADATFVFSDKNAKTTGKLAIQLIPGEGIGANDISDIYITDTDLPTGEIVFDEGKGLDQAFNPTKATITPADETTSTTFVWALKDASNKVLYTGTNATITSQLGYLLSDKKDGVYTLEAIVTDAALNTATITKTLTVLTTNPELMVEKDADTLEFGEPKLTKATILARYGVTAKDCLGNDITEAGFTIDDSEVHYNQLGTYSIKVTVSDQAENKQTKELTITIVDTLAPTVSAKTNPITLNTNEAAYQNLTEASLYELATVTAVDQFDGTENAWSAKNMTFTSNFNKADLTPSLTGENHVVEITATDSNQNQSVVFSLNVIVIDDTAPTFKVTDQIYTLGETSTEEQFKEKALSEIKDDYNQPQDLIITTTFDQVDFETPGDYPVEVTISDAAGNQTMQQVMVKVIAAPVIVANETIQYEVKSAKNEADFLQDAAVSVSTRPEGGTVTTTTDFTQTVDFNQLGEYVVTITAVDENQLTATKEVKVNVVDTTKPEISQETVQQVTYDLGQTIDQAQLLKDSSFSATDNYTASDQLVITSDLASAVDFAKAGVYPVNVTATDESGNISEALTIQVVILPEGYVVPTPTHPEAIKASNFIVKEGELDGLTAEQLIEKGQASAIKTDGSQTPVAVTDAVFSKPSVTGPNVITYTTANGKTSYQAYAVASNKQIVQLVPGFAVAMNKGRTTTSQYHLLTQAEKLDFFKVDQWPLPDLNQQSLVKLVQNIVMPKAIGDLIMIDDSAVKDEKEGTYPVVMKFDNGVGGTFDVTTYVLIIKDGAKVSDDSLSEVVMASDFTIKKDEVAQLTPEMIREKSSADAWAQYQLEADGYNQRVAYEIDSSQVLPKSGTYPITLKSQNSDTLTIYVTVAQEDEVIVDPATGEAMSANHVTIYRTEVATLTEAKMIQLAAARAWTTDGNNTEVAITKVDFTAVQPEAGVYFVTFETAKGTTISIPVTVVIDPIAEGIWKIEAEDIEFTVEEVKAYKAKGTFEQEVLTRSKVKAWDSETGTLFTPIEVDLRQLATLNAAGTYDVGFTYTAETTENMVTNQLQTQINVVVTDEQAAPLAEQENSSVNKEEQLPQTGEQQTNYLWIGLSLIVISGFVFYPSYQKRLKR
ncbi:LapB repeat-containing protein [Isobaculum melis]|uniref:LPXTG-motif cell wall anchor domain-containing protein n=1 Tax=Isobaculum melis TaxID=142588 RepID=A0A1H9UAH9_9LACT|nr:LapB repeat-containing protein [Isobaculum melis]SES06456.1 LPXTG-motif cell wall anchor domain-containing protein [Isobaculum melis]